MLPKFLFKNRICCRSKRMLLRSAFANLRRRRSTAAASSRLDSTMSQALLHGISLVNAKGETIQGEELGQNGKALALYFSADWCPDCRSFQPALNSFYKEANAQLDVVFVGSDDTAQAQAAHLADKQGPWWMVPFEGDVRTQLKRKYGVCAGAEVRALSPITRKGGIPTLVVIRADGELVDFHAADKVERGDLQALADWQ